MRTFILALSMMGFSIYAQAAVSIETIALTGEAAPGIASGATFASMLNPFISQGGDVYFRAQATGATGIWKYSHGALTNVAHSGETNRPYFGSAIYGGSPNAAGEVLIGYETASGNGGQYVIGLTNGRGIAFEGTQAPGIDGDVYFASVGSLFGWDVGFSPAGGVTFYAVLLGSNTQFGNRESLWVHRDGQLSLIARQGVPHAALPPGITFSSLEPGVIDAADRVFFEAELSDGRESIWLDDAGVLTNIATGGQQPPGITAPGVTYNGFFQPAINSSGTIAYWSILNGPGLTTTNDEAIWSGLPGNQQLIVREGAPVASADGPLTFTDLGSPLINSGGQLLFWGTESNGANGLWSGHPGNFRPVTHLGATPPGIAGDVQFDGLTDTVINSLGHVVVQGHLAGDDLTLQPGGEGYTDDTGIWFWADGRLEQVVRKGDEIEVRDNDVRRITSIDFYGFVESSGNSDGLPSPFSDEDDIAFGMRFDDGSRGVFVASVSLEPLAGDFNNDGVVDAGDYVVWRKGLGTLYNSSHFNQWRANFGETLGSGTSGAVPEPSSWLICIVFTAIAILRRRAGRRR